MPKHIEIIFPAYRKTGLLLCALLLAALLCGCVFYLVHSPAYLAAWFRGLGPCFYRNIYWEQDFFTPDVKRHGNIICCAGIAGVTIVSLLLFRKRSKAEQQRFVIATITRSDLICLFTLLLTGIGMWLYAHRHILPYMDEVFSAIHCAEGHPFQTWAYYMLPNNHVFYNLINNLLFHWADDHVLTGRLISGACFVALLLLLYGWLRQIMQYRLLALITTLAIAVHFQTWGFSAMGRGYELSLLCEWAAFIFLWQYVRRGGKPWLQLFTVAIVIGFATLPTFLYFYAALVSMAIIVQCYRRKLDIRFLRYTIIGLLLVFFFYLPSLCFSGLHAYLGSEYVHPDKVGYFAYGSVAVHDLCKAIIYCFTGFTREYPYLLAGAVPLLSLLLLRKRESLFLGLFFILMWGCELVITWQMRQPPYLRNLIGQNSMTYAFLLITLFWLLRALCKGIKVSTAYIYIYPLFLLPFFIWFIKMADERLAASVYHFDINRYAELLEMDLRDLPPGANIAFSDESFYLLYLSRKKGFTTRECGTGNEEYYIKIDGEVLPKPPTGHYQLMWERGDYRIYQRQPD